jgi:carbamoyltransferase
VLTERAPEYFERGIAEQKPADFMLMVSRVNSAMRDKIPAVTHVDGTGRLQTVAAETNRLFHGLISRFERATGVPVLLNTSFNLRGEPIVNSPAEAFRSFERSDMDLLALGNVLVSKEELR